MDLFEQDQAEGSPLRRAPLAERMRPRNLRELVGQPHLIGPDCLLPRLIAQDQFGSLILHGPPGCGKTSLAEVIASTSETRFVRLNAVISNVAELRTILQAARHHRQQNTVLLIDEIHRFNKAQQDLLLPDIESGAIRLIGATTENPSFSIINPLLSRSHLFRLEALTVPVIQGALERALQDVERGLGGLRCRVEKDVLQSLAEFAEGDLRRGLNALETLVMGQALGGCVQMEQLQAFFRERSLRYDRAGDAHYDHISAMIKSIRGSDPDAGLYWCFRMLASGEAPRFIARRLIILASEDVGLANSYALTVAVAAFEACEKVGLPECEYALAHAVLYLATAPKSNSITSAIAAVKAELKTGSAQAVPHWLWDQHAPRQAPADACESYRYSHDYPHAISGQDYWTQPVALYQPKAVGAEAAIQERLHKIAALKAQLKKGRKRMEDAP